MMRVNPKLGCFLILNLVGTATMLTIIIKQYSHISSTLAEIDQLKNTDINKQECFKICGRDYSQEKDHGMCCLSGSDESTCKVKANCLTDYIDGKEIRLDDLFAKLDLYYGV